MGDFQVRKVREYDRETCRFTDKVLGWEIFLPHQCDQWDITTDHEWPRMPTNAEAQQALRAFLDDGERAMAALQREEEYGEEQ